MIVSHKKHPHPRLEVMLVRQSGAPQRNTNAILDKGPHANGVPLCSLYMLATAKQKSSRARGQRPYRAQNFKQKWGICRLLAASTLGPNARREALVHACAHPDDDGATVLKLLASGATPSRAALHEAARNGNRRCVRALLGTQACEVDETALRHASASNDHECVRLLLDAGAQPIGATLAATSDALIARTLLDLLPASVSVDEALRAACARGAAAMVWELLRSREPSAGAWHGALVAACASDSAGCVQLVLARAGAGVASVAALHASTSAACTRLLLEHVPVDASDHEGTTALMAASARGDLEVVRVLIGREASLQGAALRLAVQHGHAPVVRELLYVGAAVPDDADGVELQGECAAVLHDARHDGTFAGRRREW